MDHHQQGSASRVGRLGGIKKIISAKAEECLCPQENTLISGSVPWAGLDV